MAQQKVTLQANLPNGTFYWVCDVEAGSEDEAVVAAEHLFLAEMDKIENWEFTEFEVVPA